MRKSLLSLVFGAVFALPAFAAGGHGGGGFGGGHSMGSLGHSAMSMGHATNSNTHGAAISAAAHDAKLSGEKVGPQVRDVARSKSQGPAHANVHVLNAVNGSHGNAASNSVLGTGGVSSTATSTAATTSTKTHHGH
ncbi:hypothetical protein [Rudaea cellulosilytica]|uniref:hypothetical protein n=1 Tax=Rudaea cellulosilytica TaxID=540746 RepID=UPI0012F74A24|nr:hypothetical protein [Rudaea cellulosilytica]